jgi:hypothetical protein
MPDGSCPAFPRRSDIASFWLKGVAAAFISWQELVLKYLNAQDDYDRTGSEEALKVTVNVDQGLPYTPKRRRPAVCPRNCGSARSLFRQGRGAARRRLPRHDHRRSGRWPSVVRLPHLRHRAGRHARSSSRRATSRAGRHLARRYVEDPQVEASRRRRRAKLIDPASYPEDWDCLIDEVLLRTYPLPTAPAADGRQDRRLRLGRRGGDRLHAKKKRQAGRPEGQRHRERLRVLARSSAAAERRGDGLHLRFHLVKGAPSASAPEMHRTFPDSGRRTVRDRARRRAGLSRELEQGEGPRRNMLGRTDPGGQVHFPVWYDEDDGRSTSAGSTRS